MYSLYCLSIWVDLIQRFHICFDIFALCFPVCPTDALKSLVVSDNNLTSSSVQTRCVSSVLICFLGAYLTLYLTLYFCLLHIQLNVFSLSIFNSNRSQLQARKSWLHLKNMILYHIKSERVKTVNLPDLGKPVNIHGFIFS